MVIEEKFIEGYNNKYCITNTGKVFVLDYRGTPCRKEMRQRIIRGYLAVGLRIFKDGKSIQTLHKIHRLVATYFIPNPENKPVVNHKDGNKLNNNVDNLEWATISENTRHACANKLQSNFWSKELAIEALNLIENYNYNFADIVRLFKLKSRGTIYHFYRKGFKTFNLTLNNDIKILKHSNPKPLPEEYRVYIDKLLADNAVLNSKFKSFEQCNE